MTRVDGRFIKPGSIPANRLDPEIPLGGEVPAGSITAAKLAAGLLGRFLVVSWGEPVEVDETTRAVSLHLVDLVEAPVEAIHAVRVTCDSRATMAVGAAGTALCGDGTDDLIAQTDGDGVLDLQVSCDEAVEIWVAAGSTQSSPMLDARAVAVVSFV